VCSDCYDYRGCSPPPLPGGSSLSLSLASPPFLCCLFCCCCFGGGDTLLLLLLGGGGGVVGAAAALRPSLPPLPLVAAPSSPMLSHKNESFVCFCVLGRGGRGVELMVIGEGDQDMAIQEALQAAPTPPRPLRSIPLHSSSSSSCCCCKWRSRRCTCQRQSSWLGVQPPELSAAADQSEHAQQQWQTVILTQ